MLRTAAGLLLAVVALIAPAPGLAFARDADQRIWDAYPLPKPDDTAARAAPSQPGTNELATAPSDDVERLAIASLLALLAGGVTTFLFSRRWPRTRVAAVPAANAPVEPPPLRPTTPELWVHGVAPPAVEPEAPAPPAVESLPVSAAAPAPPDPDRAWAAEIGWHQVDGGAQFSVTAHPVDGADEPVTLGESPPLEWPPAGARSVQALTDAVKTLESTLVGAGWTPLPRGSAWYAKRFTWQPGARPGPVPVARTRHRELYESEFSRQVERTDRMRRAISARLLEHAERAAAAAQE